MKRFYSFFLAFFLLIAGSANATTWTITFGYPFFSPKNLTGVSVGDTIMWNGDFTAPHTVESSAGQIPAGAAALNKIDGVGSSYTYVVTVAGTYNYFCRYHAASGMTGSFTAAAAGVNIPQNTNVMMDPIYPNPAAEEAMVHFTLDAPAHVTLRIYNSVGTLVQTPTNEEMGAGFHMLMIDTKELASGNYQYVLQAGDAVLRRDMIIAK